jgi:hypothetical protein
VGEIKTSDSKKKAKQLRAYVRQKLQSKFRRQVTAQEVKEEYTRLVIKMRISAAWCKATHVSTLSMGPEQLFLWVQTQREALKDGKSVFEVEMGSEVAVEVLNEFQNERFVQIGDHWFTRGRKNRIQLN